MEEDIKSIKEKEQFGPDFPMNTLPNFISDFVDSAAIELSCPKDFIVIPLLTLIGSAIGNAYRIEVKPGWQESARLWTAIVAVTGTRKTQALKKTFKWAFWKQAQLFTKYEKEKEEYEIELDNYIQASKSKKGDGPGERLEKPTPPTLKQLIVQDTTMEALCDTINHNPKGLIIPHDELSSFIFGMGKYTGEPTGDRKTYLSLWSHANIMINRVKKGPSLIQNPFLSVTGFIQPSSLVDMSPEEGMKDGFIQRFLFFKPKTSPPQLNEYDFGDDYLYQINNFLSRLFDIVPEIDEYKQIRPAIVYMTNEAREVFKTWYNKHMQEAIGLEEELTGAWAKLTGYCASFALILAIIDSCVKKLTHKVDEITVAKAITIIDEYVKPHANVVYPRLMRLRDPYEDKCAKKILLDLQTNGPLKRRQLQNGKAKHFPSSVFRKAIIGLLSDEEIRNGFEEAGEDPKKFYLV